MSPFFAPSLAQISFFFNAILLVLQCKELRHTDSCGPGAAVHWQGHHAYAHVHLSGHRSLHY